MAKIISHKTHRSGIALGGIGTGSVELFPDGEFHQWQIANPPRWTSQLWEGDGSDTAGEGNTGALSFWVRVQKDGQAPIVRKLGMKADWQDFTYRMFSWNKPVEEIEFDGRFPVCDLSYNDSALDADVKMRASSPFVPNDYKASSTPGFYLDFTLSNPTDEELTVSLLSTLEPNFCNRGGCVNELYRDGDTTGIFLNTPPVYHWDSNFTEADRGSVCLSAQGGDISYITAEHFRFMREYVTGTVLGVSQESVLFGFREYGSLPNSTENSRPARVPENVTDILEEALDRHIAELSVYPFAQSHLRRLRHTAPNFPSTRQEKEDFLRAMRTVTNFMGDNFGSCALCSKLTLAPGETKNVRFVMSWYFPNHISKYNVRLGHYYENNFADAREANRYLVSTPEIAEKAASFADLLYNTDMPDFYPEAWSTHLSTIVKDSWYLKDGKFGLWEGLGYCGFHTTDITYHASFGLLALFPELQKTQMEMGIPFQREDGRVHHFFTPDLDHVDNGYNRIDMNNQFVLMVCRDYLYTGDRGYLERMWVPVQKAMDSIGRLDTDGDGLPDNDTSHNTYDAWKFSGTPTYICILWLSALRAAVKIADLLGESERKAAWNDILERGLAALEARLWNGEYYDLWRRDDENGTTVDSCLMTDQLDGEWFTRMSGIDSNLTNDRVRAVLSLIFKNNFDPDQGLLNATCPDGKPVNRMTYKNCQADACWTGIEYVFAALAMSTGLSEISDTVVKSIHDTQMRLGHFWDHWECGFRYTRPLSSWTTMLAASGMTVDVAEKKLTFSPYREKLTVPFAFDSVLGTVSFDGENCTVKTICGSLDGWSVTVNGKSDRVHVN